MSGFEPRFIGRRPIRGCRASWSKITTRSTATEERGGSRIHVLGVAYKAGVNDIHESPARRDAALKDKARSCRTATRPSRHPRGRLRARLAALQNGWLGSVDCVVILTNHAEFDYGAVAETAHLVVDTRNAIAGMRGDNIVRL
jgi:UDP-N-acetyl-D-glucosamine dehydrogenase